MKAASVYGRLGWAVIPIHDVTSGQCSCLPRLDGKPCVKSAGKHPRSKSWQNDGTSDPAQIARWIEQYPRGNIGIVNGSKSGFFTLDVDPKNDGPATLDALIEEHGPLPFTPQQLTGSGGAHYLFSLPDFEITNSASTKLGAGLDVRGEGGQIVVAPSVSPAGAYSWVHPPWKVPLAPAPAWLLAMLRAPKIVVPAGASTTERGEFPAASADVIAGAAADLAAHGPAIENGGGDNHTFRAGAILSHDWALTEAEAWPVLLAWNETCSPPWEESDLIEKLRNGAKHGSGVYGSRRSMDALERVKKLIADWKAAGADEGAMIGMLESAREIAKLCGDKSRYALISDRLQEATGLGARDLGLPKLQGVSAPPAPAGTIEVTPRLHEVADQSIKAIAEQVFARNGVLCEVVSTGRTWISDLETARIQDLMSRAAKWVRMDPEKGMIEQVAPLPVATILHARRTHPKIRILEAVTSAPIFLADGSILQARGYNDQARVFLEPTVVVEVPDEPTKSDAEHAVYQLKDLVCDFAFASDADFSTWAAGLLSPLVKSATANAPAPLICFSAASAGAGKTMLADLIAIIVTGEKVEVSPYNPRDVAEWGKRLTAFVKAGTPVRVLDNVNGPIGDEGLDRLITSSTWSDRILGASDAPALPNVTTWLASGRNIEPQGDTVRRVLMCRIEVSSERPQERDDFKRKELIEFATEWRAAYLSAALTILRAYHVAGRPDMDLPSWGSFSTWSKLVRSALVWAGCVDPFETQRRAALSLNRHENAAHDFWLTVVGACPDGSEQSITNKANENDALTALGLREALSPHSLHKFLGRFVDKPRGRSRIRFDPVAAPPRYFVELIK